jgi:hypothetical protein
MSTFDGMQTAMFSVVNSIFGDVAIWNPSDKSDKITDSVLYNCPDILQTLGDVDKYEFQTYNYWFEYYQGKFPNLKESVDSGNIETVEVKGVSLYVRKVVTKFDGKTYIAYCELKESTNG